MFESISCSKRFSLSYFRYFQIVLEENFKTFLLYLPWPGLEMVDLSRALELIKSGVVISESLLERGRHLGKPPPHFSLGMGKWEESSDEDEMDDLLLEAAELVDPDPAVGSSDNDIDNILLEASRQFDPVLPHAGKRPTVDSKKSDRFAAVATTSHIHQMRQDAIPIKTKQTTSWSTNVWEQWCAWRKSQPVTEEERKFPLCQDITSMSCDSMNFWLCRFVVEVRRKDKKPYPPSSLYQLCCGLMRSLKFVDRLDVNFFISPVFAPFRSTLDAVMKELQASGQYATRKAEIITSSIEDEMWTKGVLGDHSPQALLDTLVFYIGMYFAFRGGEDHRRLRHHPSQLTLVESCSQPSCIRYTEDVSKTNQGGLKHKKLEKKEVVHYANPANPKRCLIRLYKLYNSKCPEDRPANAFYLKPLQIPKRNVWYSKIPVGHNALQNTVKRLCASVGVTGHFSNHSLRATAATRLFEAGVDEQLIMSRTGHRSCDGVRSYKRQTEQLKKVTSDVLNASRQNDQDSNAVVMNNTQPPTTSTSDTRDKEDKDNTHLLPLQLPTITITNSSHVNLTIGRI